MEHDLEMPDSSPGKGFAGLAPQALHQHLASTFEAALARSLPQMEVRFDNISVSADVKVLNEDVFELSTIPNVLKKSFVPSRTAIVKKHILKNVSGVFRPGTMTLVLGQPGSGKSSLMKLLSGRFPITKNVTVEGKITYNGVAQHVLTQKLPQFVSYVPQSDNHFPTLTVKETLEFAHAFTGGELVRRGEDLLSEGTVQENTASLETAKELFNHYPDVITEHLGLQKCQDTVVGDAMLRGVSGGERKRVTLGEMEFGMKYVAFMDEVSTGLDSATIFDIINTQRSIAKTLHKTIVIALLQPTPEVFALFDDVMLLNDGEVLYYGPTHQVIEYFSNRGLECPPGRDVADFLLDIGTEQQGQYVVEKSAEPRTGVALAEQFRNSNEHSAILAKLDEPLDQELAMVVKTHMDPTPMFHQSIWASTVTVFVRQALLAQRDSAFIAGRAVMTILMGLLYGSTYYQFDPTNVQVVFGTIFSSVIFIALGQMSQIPTFMANREVFYKQRGANFYRTSSYVLATAINQVPVAAAEAVTFGSLVYWMCGFESSATSYIVFMLLLLLTNLLFGMLFFFISSIAPNIYIANPVASFSALVIVIFAGFMVLKNQIPDYLIEFYWISPLSWVTRALAVNQYRSASFNVCEYGGVDYCTQFEVTMGEYYLDMFGIPSDKSWVGYGIAFLVLMLAIFVLLAVLALEYCRYETPEWTIDPSTSHSGSNHENYQLVETPKRNGARQETIVQLDAGYQSTAFTPVTIAFQDLWFTVPSPTDPTESLQLLKSVSGFARPGTLTALMGSTGAGKTTLMDVIAGRKTGGEIRGKIFLNGYEASELAIRRATGYCEQMDVHSDSTTIREALTFSALLRQDSGIPASHKYDTVKECLELLDLMGIADKMVRGSSVEQMKHLSIGVELAAQPSMLFLDEPTSGLDARAAKIVMDGVRRVANTGRTVVCTIHQPSAEVFGVFDNLLLLKHGGEMVFFGELGAESRQLINYFEAHPGVKPFQRGANPATWMLECIGAGVNIGDKAAVETENFVELFNHSAEKQRLLENLALEGMTRPAPGVKEVVFTRKRAANSSTQLRFVVGRWLTMLWRTPSYTVTSVVLAIVLSLLFGIVFVDVDYSTYQGLNSGMGMLYLVMLFNGFIALNGVIPLASRDRAAYYRERASQTYNAFWYFIGSTVAEVPNAFVNSLVFTVIVFPMVGFTGFNSAVIFWLNLSLFVLLQAYIGQFLAFLMPTQEVAIVMGLLLNNILYIFTGFTPPYASIPAGYKWLVRVNPMRYAIAIAAGLVFSDCSTVPDYDADVGVFVNIGSELGCRPLRNAPVEVGNTTVKTYVEAVFEMKHDEIVQNFGIMIAFIVFFRVLGMVVLRVVNHQTK